MKDVAHHLAESAPRFARDALAAHSTGDEVRFALYAATSLEHLLKGYLARKHPALIVDVKSFDSLLHACDVDVDKRAPRDKIKTITAELSLDRVQRFLPLLTPALVESLKQLFGVRNGAVHLADTNSVDSFVLPFLRTSEQVREALDLDRSRYWSEFETVVDSTFQEHLAAAALKTATAVAAAKARFALQFGGLEESARLAAIAQFEPRIFAPYEEALVRCPACDALALASGTVAAEWHYEEVGADDFDATLLATFIADGLRCLVCGLTLRDEDELRAAGIATRWDIDVDPSDFIEEEEPDEDYWRYR